LKGSFHFVALVRLERQGLMSRWTGAGFHQVPLGKGVVDWKAVFTAAKTGGVKNYFVEVEEDPSLMPLSVPYLKFFNV
jgi:sugar phosphate isomerase/epimerase